MTETFTVKNFTVNTVLDADIIYVKVVDNTTLSVYDVECDLVNFPNADSLEDVYKLLNNCLRGVENHACLIYAKTDVLIVSVSAQFSGYYKVKYALQLRERVSMEQKCNAICARLVALETKIATPDEQTETATPEKIVVVRTTIAGVKYLKRKTPNECGEYELYNPETRELVAWWNDQDKTISSYASDSESDDESDTFDAKTTIQKLEKEVKLLGEEIVANELKYEAELNSLKHTINYLLNFTDRIRTCPSNARNGLYFGEPHPPNFLTTINKHKQPDSEPELLSKEEVTKRLAELKVRSTSKGQAIITKNVIRSDGL